MVLILVYLGAYLCPFSGWTASEEHPETSDVSSSEGLPSSLVNHSVCAISGEFIDSVVDAVISGPESFVLRRCYGNLSIGNWALDCRDEMYFFNAHHEGDNVWGISIRNPSGTHLNYYHPVSKNAKMAQKLSFKLIVPKGLTNGASSLCGRSNVKNQKVRFYPEERKVVTTSPTGDKGTFNYLRMHDADLTQAEPSIAIYRQEKLEKLNGSLYVYELGNKRTARIVCKSQKTGEHFSNIAFDEKGASDHPIIEIKTSDDRTLSYHYKKHKWSNRLSQGHHCLRHHRPASPNDRSQRE